jgi:hypothetical protein
MRPLWLGKAAAMLWSISSLSPGLPPCPSTIGLDKIGSGGTAAAVYRYGVDSVLKEGRDGSEALLLNECNILRRLEAAGVKNVERCVDVCSSSSSISLVLTPYVAANEAVATLDGINDEEKRRSLEQKLMRTVAESVAVAGVANSDVQLLATPDSLLIIDWTEAKELNTPLTFLDAALVRSFASEALGLMPSEDAAFARQALLDALSSLRSDPSSAARVLGDFARD